MRWQVQEAKQRFSELIRRAQNEGPQFVTRHGKDTVVVLTADEFRRLRGDVPDFKDFLLAGPSFEDLTFDRNRERARVVDLTGGGG